MSDSDLQLKNHFSSKIREGNVPFHGYITLVNELLNQPDNQANNEISLMGKHALFKAHELKPFNIDVLEALLQVLSPASDARLLKLIQDKHLCCKNSSNGSGKKKMAFKYLERFDYQKAIKYFHEVLAHNSNDIEAFFYLLDLYINQGCFEDLERFIFPAESYYTPQNPYYYYYWGKRGELEFIKNDFEKAESFLEKAVHHNKNTALLNLLGESKLRMGKKDEAVQTWEKSLEIDSAQIPVYMKMQDIVFGYDNLSEEKPEGYNINILMYTYNKLDMFRQTLKRLSQTELGNAQIFLLENNCTDGTKEYLRSVHNLFPHNKTKVINLPTNIGAPAARNWLLSQPENEHSDFIAYLDDDVILQADWLKRLVGTLKAFPSAAVAGAKVINQNEPKTIQYIYRYFDIIHENRLVLSPKHSSDSDFGQFDFIRKCLSVMGCCHLFRTQALMDVGEFDVRFSPSQVDDIDHDILTSLKGYEIIYNGFIEVVHCQKAGKDTFKNRAAYGNVRGNDYKFAMKHCTGDMLNLKDQTAQRDRMDIKDKIDKLCRAGYLKNVAEVPFDVV